ncbi:hypothetical protein ACET66_11535 [Aeromonas simiae]|uniref:hypothetical protein n=1 Tax=Aeromonas simiae TaxID=218936 RepID=UPI0038CFCEA8
MHKGPVKRINPSIHLNPEQSEADRRAILALQEWYQKLRQSDSERDSINVAMRTFHRSVYLAGLRLHLLSPRLCQHVAESLGRESRSFPELLAELGECGLLPAGTAMPGVTVAAPGGAAGEADFSSRQLEQLAALMGSAGEGAASGAMLASSSPAQAAQGSQGDGAALLAAQGAEFERLHQELAQLRTLAEQQALQLQQLRLSGRGTVTEPTRSGGGTEEVLLDDVAPAAEKLQRVRQKGLF